MKINEKNHLELEENEVERGFRFRFDESPHKNPNAQLQQRTLVIHAPISASAEGAFAQLSGLVARTVEGQYGVLHLDQVRGLIRPANDHLLRTRMICLENTHNRGAGRIQPYENVVAICDWAHENGLRTGGPLLTHSGP